MATVDLTAVEYFLPLISFLLVFCVVFATLAKTKIIGESKFTQLFVAFLVASIFVTAVSAREFVLQMTPWFVIFLVALVLILAMTGLLGDMKETGKFTKGIGVVFVIGLLVVFLISAFSSFAPSGEANWFIDWIKTPSIYGAIILLAVGALVSWALVKSGAAK